MASKQEIIEAIIKSNIGDVAKGIDEAAKATKDLSDETGKLDKATDKGAKGFKGIGSAVKGVGTALKAAGIGLVVALMAKLMEVFGQNQKVVDGFKVAMNALSIAFNDFFSFLNDNIGTVIDYFKALFENPAEKIREMGTAIKEGLVARFNEFVEVMGLAAKALGELVTGKFSQAFDTIKEAGKEVVDVYTGVDGSFEKIKDTITTTVGNIKEYVAATTEQAQALVDAEKAANRADAEFAKLNATYLKQAEELRQVRDDTTKTFAERIKANEDLNAVLEKQQNLQKEAIQKQIDYAQAQYDINGSEENWIELQNQKTRLLELEETITGQLSEQKTNSVALAQELIDAENELAKVGKTARELELTELEQNYQAKLELARKAGQDTAAVDEEYRVMKGEINDKYDEEELAKAQEIANAKREVAFAMLAAIGDNLQQSLDEQADEIESNYQKEMELAEGNETEQKKIQKKFDKERKKNLKKQKKLQVAMATIETFKAAVSAYSAMAPIPVVGPVLGGVAAAAAVVAGLANVRKILKQDVGGGGGGGGTESATPPAEAKPPAPGMMSGKFELGGAIKPEPVKAYVVTDEMTDSQDQLDEIRRDSTL
jgi:hypothetical protein